MKMLTCLSALTTLMFSGTASASAIDAADVLARFDARVRGPFPATIDLPASGGDPGAQRGSTLIVTSRLRSSATFPDESPATLYDAMFNGDAAVVTRSSEGLDISVVAGDGVHVTALGAGVPAARYTYGMGAAGEGPQRRRRSLTYSFEGDVGQLGGPSAPAPLADPLAPFVIRLFLHDELRSRQARGIHAGYVAWWLHDMESNILPHGVAIKLIYVPPIPGISDLPYGTPSAITTWFEAVNRYAASRGIERTWKDKYVLITQNHPDVSTAGQAVPVSGIAMASLSGPYSVVAHELGHLFGAEHAQAEWRGWGWWPCRTNMYFSTAPLLANCYEYSAGNVARIQRYINLKGALGPRLDDIPVTRPAPAPKAGGGAYLGPLLGGNPWPDTVQ